MGDDNSAVSAVVANCLVMLTANRADLRSIDIC